jgi:hypothetical protein
MHRVLLALSWLAACSSARSPDMGDPALAGLTLETVAPTALVPGSTLILGGSGLVPPEFGGASLILEGTQNGMTTRVALPARFVDYTRLAVDWPGGLDAGLPAADGDFVGEAHLEVRSTIDGETYLSDPIEVTLEIAQVLEPRLDRVGGGMAHVNDPIVVEGGGLLLGGDEGQARARLSGCFRVGGAGPCMPIAPVEIALTPAGPFDRDRASFAFTPRAVGIQPGRFEGAVILINEHANGDAPESSPLPLDLDLAPVEISAVTPGLASLGQYVFVDGGGFVGPEPGALDLVTTLEVDGTFTPAGGGAPVVVSLVLVPEFVSGLRVRYVLSEDDSLGELVDLRAERGTLEGTIRPAIAYGPDEASGAARPFRLDIGGVKQVVHVRFLPSYTESLRHFGLRAADRVINERVLAIGRRDYAGVNLELRTVPPQDFALYSTIDVGGPDPNGRGYFGYDNTPGKDRGNLRLYDQIGGVNALTLADGNPGYGGIFVESFFTFSEHPGPFATSEDPQEDFDAIFDPFRPDRGGLPAMASDLQGGVLLPTSPSQCPAPDGDRRRQLGCAVWVLANLIGTTMTHELGHSLGLADPAGDLFHNPGDQPNRLMDGGTARTFAERAELSGEGPGMFCDGELEYLRQILPSDEPAPVVVRPGCN